MSTFMFWHKKVVSLKKESFIQLIEQAFIHALLSYFSYGAHFDYSTG